MPALNTTMARLALILALAFTCSCGETAGVTPDPSPSPPGSTCTASGPGSFDWSLPQPASNPAPTILAVNVTADTLQITFFHGTPPFQVTPQASAHFTQDPSGNPVNLAGAAGVRIVLHGFRGFRPNYSGAKTFTSTGPLLLQVAQLGDFEGYVSWGVGLSAAGCANVTTDGSILSFHFLRQ
jgi:hypothetical protein